MAVTPANVKYGIAKISVGTAGSAPTTDVGYTEDGVEISFSPDVSEIEVDEAMMPLYVVPLKQNITVTATLAETTHDNMQKALAGIKSDGTAAADTAINRFSLKVEVCPTDRAQTATLTFTFLNGYATSSTLKYKKGEKWTIPLEYKVLAHDNSGTLAYPVLDVNPA